MTRSDHTRRVPDTRAAGAHMPALSSLSIWSTILVDAGCHILACSLRAGQVLGAPSETLVGLSFERMLTADSAASFIRMAQRARQQAESTFAALEFITPGGTRQIEVELYAIQAGATLVITLFNVDRAERRTQLLLRLNSQAPRLLAARSAHEIQQHMADTLNGLDLGFTINMLTSDHTALRALSTGAMPLDRQHAIQGLTGFTPGEVLIPIDCPLYCDVMARRETHFSTDINLLISHIYPADIAHTLTRASEYVGRVGVVAAPLLLGDALRGVLTTWGPGLSQADLPVLESLSHQISAAIQHNELRQQMELEIQQLNSLATTSRAITRLSSLEDVLQVICRQAQLLLNVDQTAVARRMAQNDSLQIVMTCDDVRQRHAFAPFAAEGVVAEVVNGHPGAVVDDMSIRPELRSLSRQLPDMRSLALFGLHNQDQVLGILVLADRRPGRFDAADLDLIERYAQLAAVALTNAEAHRALKQTATRHERQHTEIIETRNYATMVIENVPDALVICDADMLMHPLNERPLRSIGFSRAELEGRPLTDLVSIAYHAQIDELWRQIQGGRPQRFESVLLRADGSGFHAWITAVPIPDSSDVLAIVTDISARHKLMQAEKMAALGRLVGGVAHELNNPLAVVLGLTQLQLLEEHNPQATADLKGIESAVLRASTIVQQLRMFVSPSTPLARSVNIVALLEEAICEHNDRIFALEVDIDLQVAPHLPVIEAEQTLLRQVFINILDNALASIERQIQRPGAWDRAITIRVWHEQLAIAIRITDTGTGIAPEHMTQIFEPFFTTLAVGQGTGLGLAVVYTIVQQHGGQIWAENTGPHGATFQIRLPLTQV